MTLTTPRRSLFRRSLSRMAAYVPGEQPAASTMTGDEIVKLNTNECPYPPSPKVVEAIREAAGGPLNRYPHPMADPFRVAAAEMLGLPGPEWILAGNGSDEILTILVRAFVGEHQKLRLPHPSYILYRTLADIQDARWDEVSFDANWKLGPNFARGDDNLRFIFLPNPNSPSGTVLLPDEVAAIADAASCPMLVDEAYVDFADHDCLSLVQSRDDVFVSRTLSKSYALAGIRFGYLIAPPDVISELSKIKDSYNCDAIATAAATAAIRDTEWLHATTTRLRSTRSSMQTELAELGFKVTPSHANFVWCTHPDVDHRDVYERLKQRGLLIRYMNYDGFGDGLRISVGTDAQWDRCRDAIADIVAQSPPATST